MLCCFISCYFDQLLLPITNGFWFSLAQKYGASVAFPEISAENVKMSPNFQQEFTPTDRIQIKLQRTTGVFQLPSQIGRILRSQLLVAISLSMLYASNLSESGRTDVDTYGRKNMPVPSKGGHLYAVNWPGLLRPPAEQIHQTSNLKVSFACFGINLIIPCRL